MATYSPLKLNFFTTSLDLDFFKFANECNNFVNVLCLVLVEMIHRNAHS